MRSRKSPRSFDAAGDFPRLSLSSDDISLRMWSAATETARQSTTSLAAFAQALGSQSRFGERRERPAVRHFMFSGHGQSEMVLSYFDPRAEESEDEKAIVA
jgi:hypothetical protein